MTGVHSGRAAAERPRVNHHSSTNSITSPPPQQIIIIIVIIYVIRLTVSIGGRHASAAARRPRRAAASVLTTSGQQRRRPSLNTHSLTDSLTPTQWLHQPIRSDPTQLDSTEYEPLRNFDIDKTERISVFLRPWIATITAPPPTRSNTIRSNSTRLNSTAS